MEAEGEEDIQERQRSSPAEIRAEKALEAMSSMADAGKTARGKRGSGLHGRGGWDTLVLGELRGGSPRTYPRTT
eukprot:jgi/Tetstr1/464271/TSEL_009074.t1